MADTSAGDGARRRRRPNEGKRPQGTSEAAHVCTVGLCPVNLALSATKEMRPEAIEHLLLAGRELLLAFRELVDSERDSPRRSSSLERIEVE